MTHGKMWGLIVGGVLFCGDVVADCWRCVGWLLMWWLIGGDVLAHWWLVDEYVLAHWWRCGGSFADMWWLICGYVVAHWWICGGSLVDGYVVAH